MSNRVNRAILCIAVALAMAFGSLLPHGTDSASDDPFALAAERHAQLEAEIAEHGHSHDDGEDHERTAGHSHGHNPADHSHETPTTPPNIIPAVLTLIPAQVPTRPETVHLDATYRLERPPRPIVIA
jgi:ABC-type nickel/cobalt efflux system permease component RcnA